MVNMCLPWGILLSMRTEASHQRPSSSRRNDFSEAWCWKQRCFLWKIIKGDRVSNRHHKTKQESPEELIFFHICRKYATIWRIIHIIETWLWKTCVFLENLRKFEGWIWKSVIILTENCNHSGLGLTQKPYNILRNKQIKNYESNPQGVFHQLN